MNCFFDRQIFAYLLFQSQCSRWRKQIREEIFLATISCEKTPTEAVSIRSLVKKFIAIIFLSYNWLFLCTSVSICQYYWIILLDNHYYCFRCVWCCSSHSCDSLRRFYWFNYESSIGSLFTQFNISFSKVLSSRCYIDINQFLYNYIVGIYSLRCLNEICFVFIDCVTSLDRILLIFIMILVVN